MATAKTTAATKNTEAQAAPPQPPTGPKFQPSPESDPKTNTLFVLDTTATHDAPPREHAITLEGGVVRAFKFRAGEPTELPWDIALKFLKHDSFKLTDADGNVMPFRGIPRQPEDLEAGERFRLADDEVVARYDELTTQALQMRCAQMPAGESVARRRDREEMVKFIVERTIKRRVENSSQERTDPDEFHPPAETDGEFFGNED